MSLKTFQDDDLFVFVADSPVNEWEWLAEFAHVPCEVIEEFLLQEPNTGDERMNLGKYWSGSSVVSMFVRYLFDDCDNPIGKRREGPLYHGDVWSWRQLRQYRMGHGLRALPQLPQVQASPTNERVGDAELCPSCGDWQEYVGDDYYMCIQCL